MGKCPLTYFLITCKNHQTCTLPNFCWLRWGQFPWFRTWSVQGNGGKVLQCYVCSTNTTGLKQFVLHAYTRQCQRKWQATNSRNYIGYACGSHVWYGCLYDKCSCSFGPNNALFGVAFSHFMFSNPTTSKLQELTRKWATVISICTKRCN